MVHDLERVVGPGAEPLGGLLGQQPRQQAAARRRQRAREPHLRTLARVSGPRAEQRHDPLASHRGVTMFLALLLDLRNIYLGHKVSGEYFNNL